jgi:hypothetical protein
MKWLEKIVIVVAIGLSAVCQGQNYKVPYVGNITPMHSRAPVLWGIGGMSIIQVTQSIGKLTPIMRSEIYDARTVEILSSKAAQSMQPGDVKVVNDHGRIVLTACGFLLAEATQKDAKAEHTTPAALANQWAISVRKVFIDIYPLMNKNGV